MPSHRGANILNWVLIEGATTTGVTAHYMTTGIDEGDIIYQSYTDIRDEDTAATLKQRLDGQGFEMLTRIRAELNAGRTLPRVAQDPAAARYFPRRSPKDGQIDWTAMSDRQVFNLIRALANPWPGAFCETPTGERVVFERYYSLDEVAELRGSMADRVVACHQPNFLPWLGFFAKIARADVFFLLDDVQFTQGANRHNWTSRVRIGAANGPMWLSLPVRRSGEGRQLILDLKTDSQSGWLPKMLKTLDESYRKAPHSAECLPPIIEILKHHQGSVCETNVALMGGICQMLGLRTTIIRSSQRPVEGNATARLVNLTRLANGTVYLSGDGADDYQLVGEFNSAGIKLRKLGFRVQPYPQQRGGDFAPGLSIVDALCNVGIERTKELLKG